MMESSFINYWGGGGLDLGSDWFSSWSLHTIYFYIDITASTSSSVAALIQNS